MRGETVLILAVGALLVYMLVRPTGRIGGPAAQPQAYQPPQYQSASYSPSGPEYITAGANLVSAISRFF